MDNLRIRAEWSIRSGSVGLYMVEKRGKEVLVGSPVEMKVHEPGYMMDPTTRITMEAAQELMDDLWSCGLRPREGAGSAGSLKATQEHLGDMQKIAFGLLKLNK